MKTKEDILKEKAGIYQFTNGWTFEDDQKLIKAIHEAMEEYAAQFRLFAVSGSLPDVEKIERHIRTHNPYPLGKQNNVDWGNGFERGVAWITGMLSGNDR